MTNILFLPSLHKQGLVSGQPPFDVKRTELFLRIKNHAEQRRKKMDRHPLLDEAAQNKAEDMVGRDYFSHTSPDGLSANENILLTGYRIPDYYAKKGNNGESIYKGHIGEPNDRPVRAWYESTGHRIHVFAWDKFYSIQECIGVGWSESSRDKAYVVFISMPCPN